MGGVLETATTVTVPDWWYAGFAAGLTIFFCMLLALVWLLLRWGEKQVDKLDEDITRVHETQLAFEADLKRRLWNEEGHDE